MKTLKLMVAASLLAGSLAVSAPASAARVIIPQHSSVHTGTMYWILACPAGVVSAALVKNWKRHKELNQQEAWTCGLLYWWNEAVGAYGREPFAIQESAPESGADFFAQARRA
jgi:hypothetical protein